MMETLLFLLRPLEELVILGGPVLVPIMLATLLMWILIMDRFRYLAFDCGELTRSYLARSAQSQPLVAQPVHDLLKRKWISEFRLSAGRSVGLIKSLVNVNILLGLLGTVIGMIGVFDVLAGSGVSDAKVLTTDISKAIIPTLAGMVSSLSGFCFAIYIKKKTDNAVEKFTAALLGPA